MNDKSTSQTAQKFIIKEPPKPVIIDFFGEELKIETPLHETVRKSESK